MKEFWQRNKPVLIISLITLLIFVGIIAASQKSTSSAPGLEKVSVNLLSSTTPVTGNPDAKVVLVEFSDFQCPACAAFAPVVKSLGEKYSSDLLIGYRHFPLPQHAFARKAAEASIAAAEQGKFWEYADKLFENQQNLKVEDLKKYAEELGLDMAKFNAALDSGKFAPVVNEDYRDGQKAAVNSTPTFFLNGKKLVLQSFDDLEKEVFSEIQNTKSDFEETSPSL